MSAVKITQQSLGKLSTGEEVLTFRLENGRGDALLRHLTDVALDSIDIESLVGENEAPTFNKYDPYVPKSLLRRAYIEDKLRTDEIEASAKENKIT